MRREHIQAVLGFAAERERRLVPACGALKLLFDENLSSRLVGALADQFPDSSHVNWVGLASATDHEIWAYAREHSFTVISKDDDFRNLSLVNGGTAKGHPAARRQRID